MAFRALFVALLLLAGVRPATADVSYRFVLDSCATQDVSCGGGVGPSLTITDAAVTRGSFTLLENASALFSAFGLGPSNSICADPVCATSYAGDWNDLVSWGDTGTKLFGNFAFRALSLAFDPNGQIAQGTVYQGMEADDFYERLFVEAGTFSGTFARGDGCTGSAVWGTCAISGVVVRASTGSIPEPTSSILLGTALGLRWRLRRTTGA